MKLFIKNLLAFSIIFFVISFSFDFYLSKKLKNSDLCYGEYEVWEDIYSDSIDAELLIYGSSRAWVNISPKILTDSLNINTYNLGLDGHNFWLQYLRHLEYLNNNESPKFIILALDFNSISKRKDLYLYHQFLPYMLWNKNIKEFTESYQGFKTYDYLFPLVRYLGKKKLIKRVINDSYKKEDFGKYRNNGYRGIKKNWTSDLEKAKRKMKSYEVIIDERSVQLMDTFLKDCKKNNIEVFMIYTPEHIEGQKFIKNKSEVTEIFNSLAHKYDLFYMDYSNDSICMNKDYFYNSTHLNKKGSELFTKKIASDLKQNLIIK